MFWTIVEPWRPKRWPHLCGPGAATNAGNHQEPPTGSSNQEVQTCSSKKQGNLIWQKPDHLAEVACPTYCTFSWPKSSFGPAPDSTRVRAQELLDLLRQRFSEPNVIIHNSMVSACVAWISWLGSRGVRPSWRQLGQRDSVQV